MDTELYVFDLDINLLGEISEYEEVIIERNYTKYSMMTINVASSKEMLSLLQQGNILTTKNNVDYGYIIENFFYTDESKQEIEVHAYSLNWLLSWRVIEKQQRYSGNVEDVIKAFVNANCINPSNHNRIIPNLILGENTGINLTTESTRTGAEVSEHCFDICNAYEMSFDVLINHDTKKFEFITWQGVDRSTLQNTNPHVIFSKDYDNIINQFFINSRTDYKTTALVAGEGEGIQRKWLTVNNNSNGFDRRETYVDARDLQSTYHDDNNNEKTLTPAEYQESLEKRGHEKLAEHEIIETFESEVDMYSQFEYGVDYGLGDKVSVRNDEIGRILHTRVISATITSNSDGKLLKVDFGTSVPSPIERIVKRVNT